LSDSQQEQGGIIMILFACFFIIFVIFMCYYSILLLKLFM
jgi:hypothetical protein